MNTMIQFTLADLWRMILAACGGIVAVSAAIGVIVAAVKKAKAPNEAKNGKINELDQRVTKHDEMLGKDLKRLEEIEEGNKVTQKALLALLSHGIDGNDIESLKKAKDDLQAYLIER